MNNNNQKETTGSSIDGRHSKQISRMLDYSISQQLNDNAAAVSAACENVEDSDSDENFDFVHSSPAEHSSSAYHFN